MIRFEMKNCNMILTEKQQKYQHYNLGKLINMNILLGKKYCHLIKGQIIEKAKFTYSPLGKAFEKQTKTIEEQERKQIDAITNQNERLGALTNKDDHKDIYKEIFEELTKEKLLLLLLLLLLS